MVSGNPALLFPSTPEERCCQGTCDKYAAVTSYGDFTEVAGLSSKGLRAWSCYVSSSGESLIENIKTQANLWTQTRNPRTWDAKDHYKCEVNLGLQSKL